MLLFRLKVTSRKLIIFLFASMVIRSPLRLKIRQISFFFSSDNIYSALLERIEHCYTRKSTCRLPIYVCIYILYVCIYFNLTVFFFFLFKTQLLLLSMILVQRTRWSILLNAHPVL